MLPVKKFGEICEFVRGPFGGSLKKSCFVSEGYAVYEQQHAIYNQFTNIRYFIDEAKFDEMKRFELKPNDLIMSCSGTMGKVAIVPKNVKLGIINQALLKLTPNAIIDVKYLSHWMNSPDFIKRIEENTVGAAIKNVASVKVLKQIDVPIPPLEEQKQIVQILDEAFAAIDKAKANIEKNIENAKELFQSKLNETFSQKDDSWEENTLINLNKFIDYRGKTPKKTDSGIPLITAKNVRMGYVKKDPQEYIAIEAYDDWMTRGTPSKGDVLFTTEAPLANVALLDTDDKIALAQRIITLCPDREVLTGKFLCYCLQSKIIQDKILSKGTGATVTGIKSKLLKEIIVPYPSLNEQRSITTFLDQLKDSSNSLTKYYAAKLRDLDELKKSILQRAFSGELTNKAQVA